mmetsp:Transcript_26115/g.73815  ORF Transcript_26115/g.73815 Transcript_26115/m.73815 type:complete len:129 (-) Transcript_26115:128-514(-)
MPGRGEPLPPLPPGNVPRLRTAASPGPAFGIDTNLDLEGSLHSMHSLASGSSGSPAGGRKKISLGGLAQSSGNMVVGVKAPSPSGAQAHSKPKRGNVIPRQPHVFDKPEVAPPPPPMPPSPTPGRKGP